MRFEWTRDAATSSIAQPVKTTDDRDCNGCSPRGQNDWNSML
jgi:hypothetical protein